MLLLRNHLILAEVLILLYSNPGRTIPQHMFKQMQWICLLNCVLFIVIVVFSGGVSPLSYQILCHVQHLTHNRSEMFLLREIYVSLLTTVLFTDNLLGFWKTSTLLWYVL